ncbi:MAG TPA: YfiR family protein [Bacteroidales bacterium]|jgi:hypothetical protein|nr:YfiR family protein [Bacteroidales bacterium]HRS18528.1 YfiR family protein [Bacteroidales bacterium]
MNSTYKYILVLFVAISLWQQTTAQTQEYVIKAVFIERFARFIEWPITSKVSDTEKPFIIGVVGINPFGSELEKLYKNQTIKNKSVIIIYILDYKQIERCDMIYISKSEQTKVPLILEYCQNKPIITISDIEKSLEMGVHIAMGMQQNKVVFAINDKAFEKSQCKVDYRLKQYATQLQ